MSKYHSKKTTVHGITFDSKREAERYCELRLFQMAGKIKELKLQVQFVLQPSFKKNGKTIRAITYVADFEYYDLQKGKYIVEDVKGYKTKEYQLKKKMFEYRYPDQTIVEI